MSGNARGISREMWVSFGIVVLLLSSTFAASFLQAYGDDIVFWGGGVDTQKVLPFGTPEQVRDEVKRRIDDFAPGGGFVFATVHNIQAYVPPENIEAAYDTALEYGSA